MGFRYTVDEDEDSISLKVESWCTPQTKKNIDYKKHIKKILKRIKQMTFNQIPFFGYDESYIIDLDIRSSGVEYNKKSYMACQIMLSKTMNELKLKDYIISLEKILDSDEYLTFTKTKKVTA